MRKLSLLIQKFHDDDQGAPEMSTVLIIALIVVPLVIGIVFFGRMLLTWFNEAGGEMRTEGDEGVGEPDEF